MGDAPFNKENIALKYMKDNMFELLPPIIDNNKVRITKVEYMGEPCIYKIYKNRNVADVYQRIQQCEPSKYLAQIYDVVFDYEGGGTHIVEERLVGETLSEYLNYINGNCMDEAVFEYVIEEICEALDVLHSSNPPIIHRDIKPSNIMMLKDGSIKLFDFDAARKFNGEKDCDTVFLGTRPYASPEQLGFCETDARSDIYSLGMTMYALLTGTLLEREPSRRVYKCSERYKRIIAKCVEFDRENRYFSVRDLLADLRATRVKKNDKQNENTFGVFKDCLYDSIVRNSLTNDWKRITFKDDLRFDKKLHQVMQKIKYLCKNEVVNMIYDDSLTGNGKCGMVITNQRIIDVYWNKSINIEDIVEIVAMNKYRIVIKSNDKELQISCTGKYEFRKVLADSLNKLCSI